jgi:hypothetical protein
VQVAQIEAGAMQELDPSTPARWDLAHALETKYLIGDLARLAPETGRNDYCDFGFAWRALYASTISAVTSRS